MKTPIVRRLGRALGAVVAGAITATLGLVAAAPGAVANAGAVVDLPGCDSNTLPRNDDGSSGVVTLPFTLNFYGLGYSNVYVNNNGNVTFDAPSSTYTPYGLVGNYQPIIAPFFADVDTRGGAGTVSYGETEFNGHTAFCVMWPGVGYYPNQVDKLNTFQLLLVQREDRGNSDFDIIFNYDSIQWETGSASGGSGGAGGNSAHAGFSSGAGLPGTSYELPGSGINGAFLDLGSNSLANQSRGSILPGRWVFSIANGSPNYIYRLPDELYGVRPDSYYVNDPVNTATGNLVEPVTDLDGVGGRSGFGLSRTYNSRNSRGGSFGTGWSSALDSRLSYGTDGTAELQDSDGRVVRFASTGTGWSRPEDFAGTLATSDGGSSIRFDDGAVWQFDADGWLSSLSDVYGATTTLVRDSDGAATRIENSTGPSVSLERDGDGHVTQATGSDGRVVTYTYSNGNLATATNPAGDVTRYESDESGRLLSETGPDGRITMTNVYDASGRVLSQVTAGAEVSFAYDDLGGTTTVADSRTGESTVVRHDPQGHPVALVDSTGATATRKYDGDGNLVSSTDRDAATTQATYDADGNMLSATDAAGNTSFWTYDSQGRVLTATDVSGATTAYTYIGDERNPATTTTADGAVTKTDAHDGLVRSITDPDGVVQRFEYDAQGNQTATIDGAGGRTTYQRDASGRIVKITTPAGRTTTLEYDALGRTTSVRTAAGATRTTFDASGRTLTSTAADGGVTTYAYDSDGNLIAVTDPTGEVTKTEYDGAGRVAATVDPAGGRTSYEYGPLGRVTAVTDPTGAVTRYEYDVRGDVVAVTDADGRTRRQQLDALGRVVSQTTADGATTTYQYDPLGNVVRRLDAAGGVSTATYDSQGRTLSVTDATGATSRTKWTPGGRVASTTDATGVTTRYGYDAAGRQDTETDALGGVTRTQYDSDGLITKVTTPAGRSTGYAYDGNSQLVRTTHPDGGAEVRTLDAAGRLTALVSAGGARSTYAYDAAGRLVASTDALGATTTWSWTHGAVTAVRDAAGGLERRGYDAAGRLTSVTDRSGGRTSYTYDPAGRLTGTADATGRTAAFTYDGVGNVTGIAYGDKTSVAFTYDALDARTSMTDGTGTTTYTRDAVGRLTAQKAPDGITQRWTYDAAGRQSSVTRTNGSTTVAAYDAAGRLVSEVDPTWGTASWVLDPDGLVLQEKLPSKQARTYAYDPSGRTASVEQTVAGVTSKTSLTRDLDGRVVATRTQGGLGSGSAIYRYDAAGQLITTTATDLDPATPTSQQWTYDKLGSRTSAKTDGVSAIYAYDSGERLASITTGGIRTSYTYDAAGRRTAESGPLKKVSYTYDGAGRLDTTTTRGLLATTTESRTYDGDGLLVGYDVTRGKQSVASTLSWDTTGPALALVGTKTGTSTRTYISGRSVPLGVVRQNGTSAVFAKDAYGSVTTTVGTADVVAAGAYDSFGQADLDLSLSDVTLTPTLGYRGSLTLDDDIALTARTYDPATGQFTSADPVPQPAGTPAVTNKYAYAANDPLDRIDPLGLSPISDDGVNSFGLTPDNTTAMALATNVDLDEWNAMHTAVQLDFLTKEPDTAMEVPIPGSGPNGGTGRADLVGLADLEIWEVKTATWHADPARYEQALAQLSRYVDNKAGSRRGRTFSGYYFTYGSGQIVVKSYGDAGMLWYYSRQGGPRPTPNLAPQPDYVPYYAPNGVTSESLIDEWADAIGGWISDVGSAIGGVAKPVAEGLGIAVVVVGGVAFTVLTSPLQAATG